MKQASEYGVDAYKEYGSAYIYGTRSCNNNGGYTWSLLMTTDIQNSPEYQLILEINSGHNQNQVIHEIRSFIASNRL